MNERIHALVDKVWHYHRLGHRLSAADALLVLCSHDRRVAEYGARLFLEGWAPLLIFSGGLGSITRRLWQEPEADQFAAIARGMGVPAGSILVENASTNTGENILFTRELLSARQFDPRMFILVQKPYMERRSFATFRKLWPEREVIVASPDVTLDEYLAHYSNDALSEEEVISIMVGDLQRIRLYPERGFQIHQDMPDDVWAAGVELIRAGYDTRLVAALSD